MEIEGIEATKIINTLQNSVPDSSNFFRISETQSIKKHFIICNTDWNAKQCSLEMRAQTVNIAWYCLKKRQRFFIPSSLEWRKTVKINDIVDDSFIAFISKTEGSKNTKRCICPSKIGITKSVVGNMSSFKH